MTEEIHYACELRNIQPKPTHFQRHTVHDLDMIPSADLVAAHIEALTSVPAYIRKLERKYTASEKSIRMKSKRITELETQVQRSVMSSMLSVV